MSIYEVAYSQLRPHLSRFLMLMILVASVGIAGCVSEARHDAMDISEDRESSKNYSEYMEAREQDYLARLEDERIQRLLDQEPPHNLSEIDDTGNFEDFEELDDCLKGCETYPYWCEPPIKGNISIDTREFIYHVHGQEYYSQTEISPEYGERWFCTEVDATNAGWRKSLR
jgi:hypothetical protein